MTFSTSPSEVVHSKHSSIFGIRAVPFTQLWAKPINGGNATINFDQLANQTTSELWIARCSGSSVKKHYVPLQR